MNLDNMEWAAVGPSNVIIGNTSQSGRVNMIAISPDVDGQGTSAMFLGTDYGGIWRSTDFTSTSPTWVPLTDHFSLPVQSKLGLNVILSLTVDANNPRVLYAGTGAGILKSSDGGNSWMLLAHSVAAGAVSMRKIVVDPRAIPANLDPATHSSLLIYAAGPSGIYKSTDGGNIWGKKAVSTLRSTTVWDLEYILSSDGQTLTLFAGLNDTTPGNDGSQNGIFSSTDAGETWDPMPINRVDHATGDTVTGSAFSTITLSADHTPGASNFAYAAVTKTSQDWRHGIILNVFRLVNQSAWTPAAGDLPTNLDTQNGVNQPIGLAPNGIVYLGVSGNYSQALFQSDDWGQHWVDIGAGTNNINPHVDHHTWAFYGNAVYDGNDGGIWRFTPLSTNVAGRGPWESLNTTGLQTLLVQGISVHPLDENVILTGCQDIGIVLSSAGTWRLVQGPNDGGRVRFDPNPNNHGAYSVTYGSFDHSDDFGKDWHSIALKKGDFPEGSMLLFEVDPFGTDRVAVVGLQAIFQSMDNGSSWQVLSPFLAGANNSVSAVAYTNNPNVIYVAYANGTVYQTTNGGGDGSASNWAQITAGINFGGTITTVVNDPRFSQVLYATVDSGSVWRTTSGGSTWENITGDFPGIRISSLVLRPGDGSTDPVLFIGTQNGVYASATQGSSPTWNPLGTGLPDVEVRDLQFDLVTNRLAAATYGRGVFVSSFVTDCRGGFGFGPFCSTLFGAWQITANGFQGQLTITSLTEDSSTEGSFSAIVTFTDAPSRQDRVIGTWNDTAKRITFIRLLPNNTTQNYTGFLGDNHPERELILAGWFMESDISPTAPRSSFGWFAEKFA